VLQHVIKEHSERDCNIQWSLCPHTLHSCAVGANQVDKQPVAAMCALCCWSLSQARGFAVRFGLELPLSTRLGSVVLSVW
jgi:hypothetical protein